MWNKWSRYLFFFSTLSLFGSLLLTGKLYPFHISLFLIPIMYSFSKYFFKKNEKIPSSRFILRIFYVSLIIRVLSVFVLYNVLDYFIGYPFLTLKDDYVYSDASMAIANVWKTGGIRWVNYLDFATGYYSGYPNISALFIYFFDGDAVITPRIGNALFSALNVIIFYKIVKLYTTETKARVVGVLLMLSPLLVTYSSLQFKDTILLCFTSIVIFNLSLILRFKYTLLRVFTILFFSVLIIFFRPVNLVPIYLAFFIVILHKSSIDYRYIYGIKNYLFITLIIGLFVLSWKYLHSIGLISSLDDYYNTRLTGLEKEISNTNVGAATTKFAKYAGAPLFIMVGLFLPPTLIVSLPDAETINYSFLGMIVHFSLLPLLLIAIYNSIKFRKKYVIPFFLFLSIIFFKVGQANSIISIFDPRQSLGAISFMYLLLPMYFEERQSKFKNNFILLFSFLVIISFAFIRLKSRGLI